MSVYSRKPKTNWIAIIAMMVVTLVICFGMGFLCAVNAQVEFNQAIMFGACVTGVVAVVQLLIAAMIFGNE